MTQPLVTRQEALAAKVARYFTGLPCRNGHVAERYVASKTCCECGNATANRAKAKNPKKYIAYSVAWNKQNPEKTLQYHRTVRQRNPGQRNMWTANYRSAKDARRPEWLTDADLFEMESVYAYCSALRRVGLDYHVDHVVPLRGATVSGLHVPWNLQVLPGRENMSKGNSFNG